MGLDALVRSGVAMAKSLTASLQPTVSHAAYVSRNEYGVPTYATAVDRPALVEVKSRWLRRTDGSELVARATVTILENVTVTPLDKIMLPDGSTGPILDVQGLADPAGGLFYVQVFLG
jgi:hypothetical protein